MGTSSSRGTNLTELSDEVERCRRCPRLVEWREQAACAAPKRFRDDDYWAAGVPGFGDPAARIAVVGLAPAANGANRTGRMFTGDRSGDWLYAALHRAELANQPDATSRADGLLLTGAYVTAVVRCAPPANKPTVDERDNCLDYLGRELSLLTNLRTIVALGGFAWSGTLKALAALGHELPRPQPKFGHGAEFVAGSLSVVGSYHVSQQNTFTGRLTEPMLDRVFNRALELASDSRPSETAPGSLGISG